MDYKIGKEISENVFEVIINNKLYLAFMNLSMPVIPTMECYICFVDEQEKRKYHRIPFSLIFKDAKESGKLDKRKYLEAAIEAEFEE